MNVVILSIWTAISPVTWRRDNDWETSLSHGTCVWSIESDDNSTPSILSKVCAFLLITVNAVALILANYEAYVGRRVNTDYSESSYIGLSMMCIAQVLLLGVPLIFLMKDNPSGLFFVKVSMVSVTCMTTLLLIFVPKVIAMNRVETNEQRDMSHSRFSRTPESRGYDPTHHIVLKNCITSHTHGDFGSHTDTATSNNDSINSHKLGNTSIPNNNRRVTKNSEFAHHTGDMESTEYIESKKANDNMKIKNYCLELEQISEEGELVESSKHLALTTCDNNK